MEQPIFTLMISIHSMANMGTDTFHSSLSLVVSINCSMETTVWAV